MLPVRSSTTLSLPAKASRTLALRRAARFSSSSPSSSSSTSSANLYAHMPKSGTMLCTVAAARRSSLALSVGQAPTGARAVHGAVRMEERMMQGCGRMLADTKYARPTRTDLAFGAQRSASRVDLSTATHQRRTYSSGSRRSRSRSGGEGDARSYALDARTLLLSLALTFGISLTFFHSLFLDAPPHTASDAAAAAARIDGGYGTLDADAEGQSRDAQEVEKSQQELMRDRADRLGVHAWGGNRYLVVAPDAPSLTLVKTPRPISYFEGMALRSIALMEKHGVCVDAAGDVYQWGLGFFDSSSRDVLKGVVGALDEVPLARRREKERANELVPRSKETRARAPIKTLQGKDIIKVTANDEKVFALSRRGEVYVFSALQSLQDAHRKKVAWSANPFKLFNLRSTDEIDYEKYEFKQIDRNVPLLSQSAVASRGQGSAAAAAAASSNSTKRAPVPVQSLGFCLPKDEKIIDIRNGASHLLALSSHGRVFVSSTDGAGNEYGQCGTTRFWIGKRSHALGQRGSTEEKKFELGAFRDQQPQQIGEGGKSVDLLAPRDPHAVRGLPDWALPPGMEGYRPPQPLPRARRSVMTQDEDLEHALSIRYNTTLFELPSLRGVPIVKIAAGSHHSLALTANGTPLAWGKQTHAATGLAGAYLGMEAIPTPTEVNLRKAIASDSTDVTTIHIEATADNSFFVLSRRVPPSKSTPLSTSSSRQAERIEVIACGKGQWGTLGNAMWPHVSAPSRVKTVSGLLEYSEFSGQTHAVPIHHIAAGAPGHVALVLDTVDSGVSSSSSSNSGSVPTHTAFGRDVMVWGHNSAFQLGTGRRNNLNVPAHLHPLPTRPVLPAAAQEQQASGWRGAGAKEKERKRLAEEDVNSGALTHMPHNRLQLSSTTKTSSRVGNVSNVDLDPDAWTLRDGESSPRLREEASEGNVKRNVLVEEAITAGDTCMAVYWKAQP
ncbi:RCC1/BLIP-II [Ceraceosorus guamensis]|uniref:RCC1/BLIP-II n=1 Tax=Ceraceosorus guamensis TaxID=1522189 RepID=A0A316VTE8_9BASI|nr:RCC1/BLIP-II [Ceraceosorus guamensis]PWN40879.1 RCC1/BLIP-II [Ceraceosorus guamensis]